MFSIATEVAGRVCKMSLLLWQVAQRKINYHYSWMTNSSKWSGLKKQKTDLIISSAAEGLLVVRYPGLSLSKMA